MDATDPMLTPPPPWVPVSAVYLRRDELIRVTSYNALAGVILNMRSRLLRPTGGISDSLDTQTANSDRSAKSTTIRQDEGWLLDGQVAVTNVAPLLGQTFVVVEIVRGDLASPPASRILAAGYATAKQPLLFPQPTMQRSLDGQGAIRSITGTTPAAGAEISETVPTGARWELLSFRTQLVTSGAVANRLPSLYLDDGAAVFGSFGTPTLQAASITQRWTWAQGTDMARDPLPIEFRLPIPTNNRLGAGYRIRTVTTNMQGADQWSAVQYLVREWIEGA